MNAEIIELINKYIFNTNVLKGDVGAYQRINKMDLQGKSWSQKKSWKNITVNINPTPNVYDLCFWLKSSLDIF